MDSSCIFCNIIQGTQPADFLFKGQRVVAFKDIKPHAPVHVLIVPVKHIRSINDLEEEDGPLISELIWKARDLARELEIAPSGYKLVFNTERGGGQYVFHLHLHLVGGWQA